MNELSSIAALRTWRTSIHENVNFVPTMGALHDGHLALVKAAQTRGGRVVVSIFVNPAQFNDPKDLANYPRTLESDLALLKRANVDAVFLPQANEIYADRYRFEVREKEFSKELDGAARPGHFEGVLTVVLKLFNLVQPTRAFFGEKDFQQLTLIRDMARALFLPIEVIGVPTVREQDGLAMSSRNRLLPPEARERAALLHEVLKNVPDLNEGRVRLEAAGFRVDYLTDYPTQDGARRFGAAFLGEVRLIDNVER